MDSASIANLLDKAPYDPSTISQLESYVQQQLSSRTYDFAANRALLKYYQVNVSAAKNDYVRNVLILSLMRLPNTDFVALNTMIPTASLEDKSIKVVQECAVLLEKGKFEEFWEEYINAQDIFSSANGFVELIRLFILNNLRDTFTVMPTTLFPQQLGLNEDSFIAFCQRNKFIERVHEENVYFVVHEERQTKSTSSIPHLKTDEGLKIANLITTA